MRQLSLFKGKRQRGVAPEPALEFASHCIIADMCKRWLHPNWKFTHLPLGEQREHRINAKTGKRFSLAGQRLARMGVTPGWPDFMFVGPNQRMFWLELKRQRSGRLSDEQRDIAVHLTACGHSYLCTDSVDDAVATLCDMGILRNRVEVQ